MDFKTALLVAGIFATLGIFTGLFLRLLRLRRNKINLYRLFTLSIKFLILYPISFPLLILLHKKSVAEVFAKERMKRCNMKNTNVNLRKISKTVMKNLSVLNIFLMWIRLLKNIIVNHENYIKSNISLAQKITEEEFKEKQGDSINIRKYKLFEISPYKIFITHQRAISKGFDKCIA